MNSKSYFVYIVSNHSRSTIYIGVTNDLKRRVYEHKKGLLDGFTKKYKCHDLVYFEVSNEVVSAITREKELKGWLRSKKDKLIISYNPALKDLYPTI